MSLGTPRILKSADPRPVRNLIGEPGSIRPVPAQALLDLGEHAILSYCGVHGIYQLPTIELLEWLDAATPDKRNALEISAGHGDLGRLLGIRSTDSYMHLRPDVRRWYEAGGQAITPPPSRVRKLDANKAVEKFNPTVVFGAWVTEYGLCGKSSMYGVHEVKLMMVPSVRRYIVIGNDNTHGEKLALASGPTIHRHPWLVGRGQNRSLNAIYDWHVR